VGELKQPYSNLDKVRISIKFEQIG